jgi:hypothetical protein
MTGAHRETGDCDSAISFIGKQRTIKVGDFPTSRLRRNGK